MCENVSRRPITLNVPLYTQCKLWKSFSLCISWPSLTPVNLPWGGVNRSLDMQGLRNRIVFTSYFPYLTPLSKFESLLFPWYTTNNGHSTDTYRLPKLDGFLFYLLGQFTSWGQNDSIGAFVNDVYLPEKVEKSLEWEIAAQPKLFCRNW